MDNQGLMSVENLLAQNGNKQKFFVPAYQRGYRWSKTQVERLIEDLVEFNTEVGSNSEDFYCLQPLVTKPVDVTKYPQLEGYREVIDGQQRLTTILLMLQAIHSLIRLKDPDESDNATLYPRRYIIKYETRESSEDWLKIIKDIRSIDENLSKELMGKNCDYSHLVEVYCSAYKKLENWEAEDLDAFRKLIYKRVRFIPYTPRSGNNNDIFDDINAGRIDLNNAELIKALLVQESNLKGHQEEEHRLNAIALEWDAVERTLQDKEFWGFIYSSSHPFTYDTHIEYLFDLKYEKTEEKEDNEYYTFDQVNAIFKNAKVEGEDILETAAEVWKGIKEIFDTLVEWYNRRPLYHRIGYLLEYGKKENVLSLIEGLKGKKKDEQIAALDEKIKLSVDSISAEKLFHGNSELSQMLFLYNVLAEDRRISSTARFSFADYKDVRKERHGWDQEHIASRTDFNAKKDDHKKFAREMIGFFTGKVFGETDEINLVDEDKENLNQEESDIVHRLIEAGNADEYELEKLEKLYNDILSSFKTQEDGFNESALMANKEKIANEKDFIWNFVLLNAGTNRGYGNSLFPVKRKRILNDEYEVYTPVGTRNVFEKAYSRKLTNMMAWTREDAKAYWEELCKVLSPYKKDNPLVFPFKVY